MPFAAVGDVARLREPRRQRPIGAALGEPADVVEVEMAGQHDVDVVDADAGLGEGVVEMVGAVEVVDRRAPGVHLVAATGVDEQGFGAAHQERPHAERDAVPIVGR